MFAYYKLRLRERFVDRTNLFCSVKDVAFSWLLNTFDEYDCLLEFKDGKELTSLK